jgi:hypothetical protein
LRKTFDFNSSGSQALKLKPRVKSLPEKHPVEFPATAAA